MQNIAIILAGGQGRRVGGDIPKQFFKIGEKTILEHSIEKFNQNPNIDEIALVIHADYTDPVRQILQTSPFSKVRHILPGGQERYHSVQAALKLYRHKECNLIIHDAVRPAVSQRIINDVIGNLKDYRAVNVAIPCTDTMIETDMTNTYVVAVPDRSHLYNVQTPQGFYIKTLEKAYEKALQDVYFHATDDCGVVHKYLPEEKIKIVAGENCNIKFTYAGDLLLLRQLLKEQENEI